MFSKKTIDAECFLGAEEQDWMNLHAVFFYIFSVQPQDFHIFRIVNEILIIVF